jgi:type IV pilus assembly protein PilV
MSSKTFLFKKNNWRFKTSSGSSLLEVLIAILIMSFGMLGLAGKITAGLQYNKMAQFQTIGVQLSSDIADRMRANVDGFRSNAYNKTGNYNKESIEVAVPTCALVSSCTPAEIAAIDLAQWRNALRLSIPGGDAQIIRDTSNSLAVDIWIMWSEASLATGLALKGACPQAALTAGSEPPSCLYFRVFI